MAHEIERKFFVKEMPSLEGVKPLRYERYILSKNEGKEIRIQKVGDTFVHEEKNDVSDFERTKIKREISREEFEKLKLSSDGEAIIRDRYDVDSNPRIAIQIYHGRFEGLVRAEVEFASREKAEVFKPLPWMGEEMTSLPIARDATLSELSGNEFAAYLENRSGI